MATLAPSILIGSSSFLEETRITITSWMSSNLSQIRPWTAELAALECLKNQFLVLWPLQHLQFWSDVKKKTTKNKTKQKKKHFVQWLYLLTIRWAIVALGLLVTFYSYLIWYLVENNKQHKNMKPNFLSVGHIVSMELQWGHWPTSTDFWRRPITNGIEFHDLNIGLLFEHGFRHDWKLVQWHRYLCKNSTCSFYLILKLGG